MAIRRLNTGLVLSASAHVAVLLYAAVSFAGKSFEVPPTDSIFIETMPMSEFSQMVAGSRTAKPQAEPKPLVEKKAEPRPAKNQSAPVEESKQEVTASASAPPPPAPPIQQPPKERAEVAPPVPPAKPPAKPVAKPAAEKPPPPKPEAEALKPAPRSEPKPKPEPRKLAATAPTPPKRPPPQKRVAEKPPVRTPPVQEPSRFDADQISALLDKRRPQRLAAAGDVINTTPNVGATTGNAAQLSQNEIDALRARIQQCWNPPAGQADARDLTVLVRIQFNPDGSLATAPALVSRVSTGYHRAAAESALRAISRCAPYSFMPAAKFESWKDIEVNFDPRDLFRG